MNVYLTDQEVELLRYELYLAAGKRLKQIAKLKDVLKSITADDYFLKEHCVFLEKQLKQAEEEFEVLDAVTKKFVGGG